MTKELRNLLKNVLHVELERIQENLEQLEPKERLEIIIKMMPYVLPKIKDESYTINEPLSWD